MRIIDTFKIGVFKEDSFLSKKECKDVITKIDNYKFIVCDLIKNLSESYINLVRKKVAA